MLDRKLFRKVPILPLTVFFFYIIILTLSSYGLIPHPRDILFMLEGIYQTYGLPGLFVAAFIEGIIYLGLYFPGSFVILMAAILSKGDFAELSTLVLIVALTWTLTAYINYKLGSYFSSNKRKFKKSIPSFGLFPSFLHPTLLSFYFFEAGLNRERKWHISLVPLVLIPYGLVLVYFLSSIGFFIRKHIGEPKFIFTLVMIWFVIAYIFEEKAHLDEVKEKMEKQ